MEIIIERAKDLSTIYLYFIILGTTLFGIVLDSKALKKKKLKKEEQMCKVISYLMLALGTIFFIATNYIL